MHKTYAQQVEWIAQARRGVFYALAHYRRRLQQEDQDLRPEERRALVDLLMLLEEYVEQTWVPDIVTMTARASARK